MRNKLFIIMQYLLPQQLLSRIFGWFADSTHPLIKTFMIQRFLRTYKVDMSLALQPDPHHYLSFNQFFIRKLHPSQRLITPLARAIASPVDGTIAQMGEIQQNLMLQIKNFYFNLEALLGNEQSLVNAFYDGAFATFYLAPHNYHRVHMPLDGTLISTLYIPGKLFSVNQTTTAHIPNLYSRNERLIAIFSTEAGLMAVIFVGAMIVGSIHTVWMQAPIRSSIPRIDHFTDQPRLAKGDELGYFKLGSTVILLFEKNKISWSPERSANAVLEYGQAIGSVL